MSIGSSGGQSGKLLAIVGPTASGKTALALEMAKTYNGEIICADSRTIYKGLNIGTAKPTVEEQASVKHYGLDLVEPNEHFSAANFQTLAYRWILDIQKRGKLPILVGGTGLYVDSVLYRYEFGDKPNDLTRKELEAFSIEELQERIITKNIEMPENSRNKRYLIRALEQGGVNRKHHSLSKKTVYIGLDPGKEILESRVKVRADIMKDTGVIDEAAWLKDTYGFTCPGASGNIYRALEPYFNDEKILEDCFLDFISLDRRLAKRQRTWFRRNKDIHWFAGAEEAAVFLSRVL